MIGIGAGDPEQVTIQAVNAINRSDVFFVLDKGEVKQELVDLRSEILTRYATHTYRVVHGRDPERDRTSAAYVEAVDDWRRRRADVCQAMIASELDDDQTGAFLVWGDPSLYDSTLAILSDISSRGSLEFEVEVIPGISSVAAQAERWLGAPVMVLPHEQRALQATRSLWNLRQMNLAARHRIPLNQVGKPVQITTGRRLAQSWPAADVDDVVVMLDAQTAFTEHPGADIYWGAYLGTPDEILISGPVTEVADHIVETRAEARRRKGWIMDTYLLRRDSRG